MNLIALAIPFFILALLLELALDRFRGTGYFRTNDALNSLSAGVLSTTFGYFTRLLQAVIWAYVLQHLALFEWDLSLFDASPRGIALWGLALLAFDFSYYWAHRFGHEISILWAAHAVHHQSEDYNLSTALRQTSTSFLFGWVFYLPLFLLGMPFEVFVTVNAIDLIYQFWVHTQHIRRLGWMEKFFVTPSNHRVHHAQNEIYIDRNYGGILIIWDRMFGTFQEELAAEPVTFGVRKPLRSWNPFWANFQVYAYLWFDAVRTAHWKDKVSIWFRRTGWRPADVDAKYPKRPYNPQSFEKFDPPLGRPVRRYLVFQYLAVVLSVLWIGTRFATEGALPVLVPCILLWATLYGIGLMSERRSFATRFELARLIVVLPTGVLLMEQSVSGNTVLLLLIYLVPSLGLLAATNARTNPAPEVHQGS